MFQNTLDYIKENKGVSILAGVGVIAASGLAFAAWVGSFKKIELKEKLLEGGTFVYIEYKGQVGSLSKTYGKVMNDYYTLFSKNES